MTSFLHPTPIPLTVLLHQAGLSLPPACEGITVTGVSTDSRTVVPGDVFVAISGLHTDARVHIPEAIRRGAVAIVTEGEPVESSNTTAVASPASPATPVFVFTSNTRVAAACLYDALYDHPARELCLVGVTGTNGKTTVSCLLYHILRTAGIPCGLIGTVGWYSPAGDGAICPPPDAPTGMTTPDPAFLYPLLARMAADARTSLPTSPYNAPLALSGQPTGSCDRACGQPTQKPVIIMEVTSHALRLGKVAPLTFERAVFTNLSPEHLDLHGTMEDYYASKRRLFTVAREVVINADDRAGRMLLAEPLPVRHFHICHAVSPEGLPPDRMCPAGETSCTRHYAEQVKLLGEDGIAFKLTSPDLRLRLRTPLCGGFNVMNAMQAVVTALSLGVSPATVRDALRDFPGVPGRMERVLLPPHANFSVYIDFAHTPDALENLLRAAHTMRHRGQRIILLFGCGGDRDRSKRRAMAHVASRMADALVITSDNPRSEDPAAIISDILSGVDKESEFTVISDRRRAIRETIRQARAGDIILLAGKGHETYEITASGSHPFSEASIVREAAAEFWGSSCLTER